MGSEKCGFCSIYGEACDATGVLLGKDAKKVRDAVNRGKGLWKIRLRCRNWGLTPLIILSKGPMELPKRWVKLVDKAMDITDGDRELVETCIKRSRPMGEKEWMIRMAARLGLEATLRPRGRPRKGV